MLDQDSLVHVGCEALAMLLALVGVLMALRAIARRLEAPKPLPPCEHRDVVAFFVVHDGKTRVAGRCRWCGERVDNMKEEP